MALDRPSLVAAPRTGCRGARRRRARSGVAPIVATLALVAAGLWLIACSAAAPSNVTSPSAAAASVSSASSPGASIPPVVRSVLAIGEPAAAPDQNLALVRYTIAPHTSLAPHHHPGMQLALIESGTLTYSVIEGTIVIHAADGSTRSIGPGQTGTIEAGEWIAETESIVHFGANDTDRPVVILAASLLAADEPPAIPVSPAPSG